MSDTVKQSGPQMGERGCEKGARRLASRPFGFACRDQTQTRALFGQSARRDGLQVDKANYPSCHNFTAVVPPPTPYSLVAKVFPSGESAISSTGPPSSFSDDFSSPSATA